MSSTRQIYGHDLRVQTGDAVDRGRRHTPWTLNIQEQKAFWGFHIRLVRIMVGMPPELSLITRNIGMTNQIKEVDSLHQAVKTPISESVTDTQHHFSKLHNIGMHNCHGQ